MGREAADVSGCFFSVLLQKVKIKIQNDVIVHQSASLSVGEDVRISFKQSYQCLNALKCQKCAIKEIDRKILMLTPGPLIDRKILMLTPGPLVQKSHFSIDRFRVKSSSRRVGFSSRNVVVIISAIVPKVLQNSFFDRSFSGQVLAPGPLFVLSAIIPKFYGTIVCSSRVFGSSGLSLQVKKSGFQVEESS